MKRLFDLSGKVVALDIADESAVEHVVQAMRDDQGRLEVMVNCACMAPAKRFELATADDWRAALEVNLTGAFLLSRAAGRVESPDRWSSLPLTRRVRSRGRPLSSMGGSTAW